MGLAKTQMMEEEERGWSAPDKYVCAKCLEDDYLKGVVSENAEKERCDYCGQTASTSIAAPVSAVLEPISEALFSHFADPSNAGLPRESGEWVGQDSITDTEDALLQLCLECNDKLFNDIKMSFINDAWYPCANGHWLSLQEHEELRHAWNGFCHEIKHHSRYFFTQDKPKSSLAPEDQYTPLLLLKHIGNLVEELDLIKALPKGTPFFRVRLAKGGERYEKFKDVGPPPEKMANAGRMNPPGISYFYLALEAGTAIAEIVDKPPSQLVLAEFNGEKELTILDLTDLPDPPSVFDTDNKERRDGILFLDGFIRAIASPISKDGREHVEYVPSQVCSEYFSQMFSFGESKKLDGIVYPSTIHPTGKNVVIFPIRELGKKWENILKLQKITQHSLKNWEDIKKAF